MTASPAGVQTRKQDAAAPVDEDAFDGATGPVFIDLDSVLIAFHQGRRGLELGLQADLELALDRLSELGGPLIVLAEPTPRENGNGRETARRLETLREGIGDHYQRLLIVTCPHGEDGSCNCAKPGSGLIEHALREHNLSRRGGWLIGGDQECVQAARHAGLKTIRIGPLGDDHRSAVHRADYDARDLTDAATRIMLESLSGH
ncbi:MAG TPA: HAD hydrolase-like protein [Candidatus Limnocylindria bacterium]|nr:HAD hydrolase-like protein [Candidatus Limnocylindria bacterium]